MKSKLIAVLSILTTLAMPMSASAGEVGGLLVELKQTTGDTPAVRFDGSWSDCGGRWLYNTNPSFLGTIVEAIAFKRQVKITYSCGTGVMVIQNIGWRY